jgi:hypothetical protein
VNQTVHEIGLEAIDALSGVDTVCLFIPEDERPLTGLAGYVDWRLSGMLSRVLMGDFFRGAALDTVLMPTDSRIPAIRLFAVGLGALKGLDGSRLGDALKTAAEMLNKAKVTAVALEPPAQGFPDEARAHAFKNAFLPAFQGDRLAVFADKNLARLL